jgi:hypothetical protein
MSGATMSGEPPSLRIAGSADTASPTPEWPEMPGNNGCMRISTTQAIAT